MGKGALNKVVSGNGGFYNPSDESVGEFYLHLNGIPRIIRINYDGIIDSINSDKLADDVLLVDNNNTIILSFKSPKELTSDILFTFLGKIDLIKKIVVYNWGGGKIIPDIIDYDQIDIPLNKSETNFEDDSILIKEPEIKIKTRTYKKRPIKYTTRNFNKKMIKLDESNNLPENYEVYNRNIINTKDEFCYNCIHFKKFYCHKWNSNVEAIAWCKSWERKQEIK